MKPEDLALYVIDRCGYCDDVRDAARELGLELEERDLADLEHRRALIAARGRKTVPVLRIGEDRWMPESQDIIAYLHERFGDGRPAPSRLARWLGR